MNKEKLKIKILKHQALAEAGKEMLEEMEAEECKHDEGWTNGHCNLCGESHNGH